MQSYRSTHDLAQVEAGGMTTMKDDHRYNALRNIDNQSDASTEVGDWDTEGETRLRRRTIWKRVRGWHWVLDTVLLLVIIGLLVEKRWRHYDHRKSHAHELAGDITGFAPTFSQQIVSFKPDAVFAPDDASEFWSNETQHAWLSIVPEGLGYVNVEHPNNYNNLPHPIHDYPNHTIYTTSMTHQLHCLYTILEAYNTQKLMLASPLSNINPIKMPWHLNHCFEYMRQAIMCAGDVALEGASTTFPPFDNGEDRGGSDGWDAKHVCKDYGQVYDYLEKSTINHWKWISSE